MQSVGVPLDPEDWLPAPSQGAIGIECNLADERTRSILAAIDDASSHARVKAERALLEALGGNCHSSVAVICEDAPEGDLYMRAALFSEDGVERVDGEVVFPADDPDAPKRLAADLLEYADPAIRRHFAGST